MSAPDATQPVSTFAAVRTITEGVGGGTSPVRAEQLFAWVAEHRPTDVLELGFAHGVSTVTIAAALEGNGGGRITGSDNRSALERDPSAQSLLDRAGLAHRAELHYDDTSYTWFLQRRLREQSTTGSIVPCYDLVFLDGAHTWDADALAYLLSWKLLRPGGWLLLDDLGWTPDDEYPDLPASQKGFSHVTEVYELLALTDPQVEEVRADDQWAWIRKSQTGEATVRTVHKQDLVGSVRQLAGYGREAARRARRR